MFRDVKEDTESQVVFSPRKLSPGTSFNKQINNNVLKMARKYSTRIKRKEDVQKRLRGVKEKVKLCSN